MARLGKGLGALFGEDVVEEVSRDHAGGRGINSENGNREVNSSEIRSGEANSSEIGNSGQGGSRSGRSSAARTAKAGSPAGASFGKKESNHSEEQKELSLKLTKIEPNPEQPRKDFDEEELKNLADSIQKYGVLQPLLVQKKGSMYEIIAGERRWRAAKMAGLKEVPVVIREYGPQQAMEISLIENVQRADLNPIEEALAYKKLMQEFELKQEEIAERVSKNRTTITNSMRLLNLTEAIQQMLIENRISGGHARALLALDDPKLQLELAQKIEQTHMSVRDVERAVKQLGKGKQGKKQDKNSKETDEALNLIFQDLENRMKTVMGTKVNISRKDKTKGKIEIEYYSEAELERIVELIESIR